VKQPAVESRGGEHPDWANARPGEALPQLPVAENHDDDCGDTAPLESPCPDSVPGCGGT
jgi:hypothetical protein